METAALIFGAIVVIALVIIFRKHLKKIGIGIGIILAGWLGIENIEEIPNIPEPDPIEIPGDSTGIEHPQIPPVVVDDSIPEPPSEEENIYRIKDTVVSQGTDLTLYFLDQISKIPDGTVEQPNTVIFPEGRFLTMGVPDDPQGKKGIFRIRNRHNLIFKGNGTVFYTDAPAVPFGSSVNGQTYSHRRHFWIFDSSNLVFEGITVKGSNYTDGSEIGRSEAKTPHFWKSGETTSTPKGFAPYVSYWAFEHGFSIMSSKDIVLDNITVENVFGDGVYIGGSHAIPSRDITIKNSYIHWAGRQGIAAANNADGILIDNVNIDMVSRSAVDFEPHSGNGYVINVEVKNSRLYGRFTAVASVGKGNVSNVYVHDNEYQGTTVRCYGNPDKPRENWRWINNTRTYGSYGSPVAPAIFRNTNNITYRDNVDHINTNQSDIALELGNCGGVLSITGNDFISPEAKTIIWGDSDTTQLVYKNNNPNLLEIRKPE